MDPGDPGNPGYFVSMSFVYQNKLVLSYPLKIIWCRTPIHKSIACTSRIFEDLSVLMRWNIRLTYVRNATAIVFSSCSLYVQLLTFTIHPGSKTTPK